MVVPTATIILPTDATLNAERGYYGDPRLVTLPFRLINDSDQILDSATASWTLVIDDREVPDRGGGQLWERSKKIVLRKDRLALRARQLLSRRRELLIL